MKLKDKAKDLKVGDILWIKIEIDSINPPDEDGERYFNIKGPFPNSCLEAGCYGDTEIHFGDDITEQDTVEVEKIVEKVVFQPDLMQEGKIEVYEKLLLKRKVTIEN